MTGRSKAPRPAARKGGLPRLPLPPGEKVRLQPNGQALGAARARSRAHSRAFTRLRHAHAEEFDRLLHEEFHVEGYAHMHGPDDPETIDRWGPDRGQTGR